MSRRWAVKKVNLTPEPLRNSIYEVNMERYKDPLGPPCEDLYQAKFEKGMSPEEAYGDITRKTLDDTGTP